MGILSRVRERSEAFVARHLEGESVALAAAIPGSSGPLCELKLEAQAEPESQGERVRLRAHFRLHLRAAPALPDKREHGGSVPARVGRWIERRLNSRWLRAVAAPVLNRTVDSWVEVRASSAPLDEGSRALVPEKLHVLGVEPQPGKPFQVWAGGLGGARPGFATLGLVQLDKNRLPPPVQQALGPKPFHLSATLVSVIEDA